MSRDRWKDKNVPTFLANSVRQCRDNSALTCLVKLARSKRESDCPQMILTEMFNFQYPKTAMQKCSASEL